MNESRAAPKLRAFVNQHPLTDRGLLLLPGTSKKKIRRPRRRSWVGSLRPRPRSARSCCSHVRASTRTSTTACTRFREMNGAAARGTNKPEEGTNGFILLVVPTSPPLPTEQHYIVNG